MRRLNIAKGEPWAMAEALTFMMGKYPADWNAFCANMTKQLQ